MTIHCNPQLVCLYEPFAINIYGMFIALGIIVCMWLISFNKRYAQLHLQNRFASIVAVAVLAGIIGGRFLDIITSPHNYRYISDWFTIWNGGFSALGSIVGVSIITPLYLLKNNIP